MPDRKFELTREQFGAMLPNGEAAGRLGAHWSYVNDALAWGGIDTPVRAAAFFAQLAHESGEYLYMEELASGSAYEGREDLGNTQPGDGRKYKGHGPIQITGRNNHRKCGAALGLDLIGAPKLITLPEYATKSAVWFWRYGREDYGDLSLIADQNTTDSFRQITRAINGGYTGLHDRLGHWGRCKRVLGVPGNGNGVHVDRVLRLTQPRTEGDDVLQLQRMLNKVGGFTAGPVVEDGIFGTGTDDAVREFQRAYGLVSDGIVGPRTWAELRELTK